MTGFGTKVTSPTSQLSPRGGQFTPRGQIPSRQKDKRSKEIKQKMSGKKKLKRIPKANEDRQSK